MFCEFIHREKQLFNPEVKILVPFYINMNLPPKKLNTNILQFILYFNFIHFIFSL